LSNKVSSTLVGLWFLAAEHLRLGSWDLVRGYTGGDNASLDPRIAMQMINEASMCKNRIRRKNYISHQGFELLNGLGFLATDEQVHGLLRGHTTSQAQALQETLSLIRLNRGHYTKATIALDPHRIISTTKRTMPNKRKNPDKPSRKMLQTFFALDTSSGQPIGFGIGSPGVNTTEATKELLKMVERIDQNALVLADKEHFTNGLLSHMKQHTQFEFLTPAITSEKIRRIIKSLDFKPLWAGYAIAETPFHFTGKKEQYRLLVQREGEMESQYQYRSFLAISDKPAHELLSEKYQERWSIEEFFNFDGAIGFDRASTFNLNIRYGKMSLALLAQAANYQLRQKLPSPYNQWNSIHLADALFNKIDGDIRAVDDTIIVTCYNVPNELKLSQHYQNLPKRLMDEGIDPRIPWLYDFKLDFRFR
jgi:hypothetical protein